MKWPIPADSSVKSQIETRSYWESSHADHDYGNVVSVTEDEGLLTRLAEPLKSSVKDSEMALLIPGCGSRSHLEEYLVSVFPGVKLTSTDFPEVIRLAAQKLSHDRVEFIARDSRELGYNKDFDAAILVNATVSDSDEDNRRILASTAKALKPEGVLVGLFPTIFSHADLFYCDPGGENGLHLFDLQNSRYHDPSQGLSQILYTPLRLRAILREAGFSKIEISIYFLDSPHARNEFQRLHAVEGEDSVLYELLVVARRDGLSN